MIYNWRERLVVDLKELGSNYFKIVFIENWRERNFDYLGDICNKGLYYLNWRDRKLISVDEFRKDVVCSFLFGGRFKRYSIGDI